MNDENMNTDKSPQINPPNDPSSPTAATLEPLTSKGCGGGSSVQRMVRRLTLWPRLLIFLISGRDHDGCIALIRLNISILLLQLSNRRFKLRIFFLERRNDFLRVQKFFLDVCHNL